MTRAQDKPLVVKVGGSLAEGGRLAEILEILARARRRVVIVPGGGPFADAVRSLQAEVGLADEAAHRMAILAMHQMADVFVALQRRLVTAASFAAMRRAWRARRIPVWLPLALCEGDDAVPCDWSITSDGLAARLAERLGGVPVALVKSCRVDASLPAATLARAGVVDPYFAGKVAGAGLDWRVLGAGDESCLAELVSAAPMRSRAARKSGERSTARR